MASSHIQLPPDGSGKRLHTVTEDGVLHNQVMTLGDPKNPTNHQFVDEYGAAYIRFAEGNTVFDAFGKTKVSQETMVAEYMPTYDSIPTKVQTKTSGAGVETFLPNESSVKLQVGTTTGDKVQRTTNKYHKYFSGTSQLIEFTIVVGDFGKAGVTRRWGYYDDNDGIIMSMDGTAFNIVMRSSVSGTVVDTLIPQSAFNSDKADGTGISGVLVDPSKANIYWIDIQWLGAGRVRVGGYTPEGFRVIYHEIQNTNQHSSVYMQTGSLPLRWEMYNTAMTASTSEMKVLNAVVYTETASLNTAGKCFSSFNFNTLQAPKVLKADGTFDSLIAIRPKAIFNGKENRSAIVPHRLIVNTNKPVQVAIMTNVDNGANTWVSVNPTSFTEKSEDVEFVALTANSSPVFCGIAEPGNSIVEIESTFGYLKESLHLLADGTQPTYTVICRTLDGTSANVTTGITWTELII